MAQHLTTQIAASPLYRPAIITGLAAAGLVHLARYRADAPAALLYIVTALLLFPLMSAIFIRARMRPDPVLLPVVCLLSALGLAEIYRLQPDLVFRQASWIVLGCALLLSTATITRDPFALAKYRYLVAAAGLAFLAAALVFGAERGGTRQWIEFGVFSVQPSEVVKVLLVLFFASHLAEHRTMLSARRLPLRVQVRALGPIILVLAFSLALLAVQRDFGAAILYFSVVVVMLYAATGRIDYVAIAGAAFLLGAIACYLGLPHVRTRVEIWLNPWADAQGSGYQLVQSIFALGSGGLSGSGLGLGHPEFIPAAHTDFIFSVIGEELGLAGAILMELLFLLLVTRAIRIGLRAPTAFTRLVAVGAAAVLGIQTLVIVAGSIRMVPLTGVTLPFVSYGGSSIVSNFILIGLLIGAGAQSGAASRDRSPPGHLFPGRRDARPIIRVAALFTLLFAGVMTVTGYWQIARASELATDPRNPRLVLAERKIHRGTIFDRRLRPLAVSEREGERFVRRYPEGDLAAHVTGYRSERLGKTGIERALDRYLLGLSRKPLLDEIRDRLTGRPPRGLDAILTIDATLQRTAADALGNRRGAIIVLDPRDGAVLAMVSEPRFDPYNIDARWPSLQRAPQSPLLDRATSGQYPPGSAFKVVTMAAALGRGAARPETTFHDPGFIIIRNTRITNFEGQACGTVSFVDALVRSCNVVFINVGIRTGGDALREYSKAFGLGRAPRFELPAAAGRLPPSQEVRGNGAGQMAFGQGSLLVTPLQMALVAATIARGGETVAPYLVREIRADDGTLIARHTAAESRRAIDPRVAQILQQAMVEVVRRGTGRAAALPGVKVAGKTGTATVPEGQSHAWFIGFAPAEQPRVAFAVVIEHGGIGGRDAAPIARKVLQHALKIVE